VSEPDWVEVVLNETDMEKSSFSSQMPGIPAVMLTEYPTVKVSVKLHEYEFVVDCEFEKLIVSVALLSLSK